MSQLYHVLRRVISFGLDLYFVDIQSHGVENVPKWDWSPRIMMLPM